MAEHWIFLGLAFCPNNVYLNIHVKKATFQKIKLSNFHYFCLPCFAFLIGKLFVGASHVFNWCHISSASVFIDLK